MDVFHRALEPLAAVPRLHTVGREDVVDRQLEVAGILADGEDLDSQEKARIDRPLARGDVISAANLVDSRVLD